MGHVVGSATVFPTFAPAARERWVRNAPFLITGAAGVVGGGFVAAVAGAVTWGHGAWTAAFVVLVVGVAQLVLGVAQAALAPALIARSRMIVQFLLWNSGCAVVITGSQIDTPVIVAVGSALFLGALVMAALEVRTRGDLQGAPRVLLAVYRALLVVLLVSVFVGILLSIVGY